MQPMSVQMGTGKPWYLWCPRFGVFCMPDPETCPMFRHSSRHIGPTETKRQKTDVCGVYNGVVAEGVHVSQTERTEVA